MPLNKVNNLETDETQTGTTTQVQSGSVSNGNEWVLNTPPELEPHHELQFSYTQDTPFLGEGFLAPPTEGYWKDGNFYKKGCSGKIFIS